HGHDSQSLSGRPAANYVNAASSQAAVSLPSYGEGRPQNVDGGTVGTTRKVLGTYPVLRSGGDFTVTTTVTPGPTLLNTLTNAMPPLTNPKDSSGRATPTCWWPWRRSTMLPMTMRVTRCSSSAL